MPTYLDVAVIRIQDYLTRSPALSSLRAGSALISAATSDTAREELLVRLRALFLSAQPNSEAASVDGLVNLVIGDGSASANQARTAAGETCRWLRELLPGAVLDAVWADAPSYATAFQAMAPLRGALLTSYPPMHDYPPLRLCSSCQRDPVTVEVADGLCLDCAARAAGGPRGKQLRATTDDAADLDGAAAERGLLRAVAAVRDLPQAEDFAGLAAATGSGNHLFTIALDGNNIGALFAGLAENHADSSEVQALSTTIKKVTTHALYDATLAGIEQHPDLMVCPVIPHVLGGDDVLLSVNATVGWDVVRTLLHLMDSRFADDPLICGLTDRFGLPAPSASAGVVIAQQGHPLSAALATASSLMREAKRQVLGQRSSVLWLDITRDGTSPPRDRSVRTLQWMHDHDDVLRRLAEQPRAGLYALETAASDSDLELGLARTAKLLIRSREDNTIWPLATELVGDLDPTRWPSQRTDLLDALSLIRWWPHAQ